MDYDMVFEGGGAKGMVFVGAMQEFEARGHHHHRLLGTSAGAITASLLAAGYSSGEMLSALSEQKDGKSIFVGFMAEPSAFQKELVLTSGTLAFLRKLNLPIPGFIRGRMEDDLVLWLATEPGLRSAYSLLEYGGWYSADNFIAWMQERLDTGSYNGKPRSFSALTLSQFYDQTHTDLSVVASDTTGGAMLVLNHMTAPNLPLVWAVRMSMSIPLVWQAVVWLEQWGLYRGQDMSGHIIVDGGLLSNFPIELFVSDDVTVKNVMGPKDTDSVLGLLIDETLPVGPAQTAVTQVPPVTISDFPA
ncbi:MAG TPA: patatin-like phospholipase family protein, partial [Anaerolineaceae bacterium]